MSSMTPVAERFADENVVKVCDQIKKWLGSPPTPTRRQPQQNYVSSSCQQIQGPVASDEHGGVSLHATEDNFVSGSGTAVTANTPQWGPWENSNYEATKPRTISHTQNTQWSCEIPLLHATRGEQQILLPAPLQVTQKAVQRTKTKRSMSSWSVSDGPLEINNDENQGGVAIEQETTVNVGPWVVSNVAEPPAIAFTFDCPDLRSAYRHDIDPCTGKLVPEIQYPETIQDRIISDHPEAKELAWRQANLTSELQILRELKGRENLAAKVRSQMKPQPQPQPQQEQALPVEEIEWPRAECKLRPAAPADFGQIAAIMNMESRQERCPQALESRDITRNDVERIFNSCRENMRPFIVATEAEDQLFDRSKWPKHAEKAYQEWLKFKRSQPRSSNDIVGFAFVTDARIGLLDSTCRGSRFTGQIRLIVHQNHRRKRYGSALLDRILLCVAPDHCTRLDYDWHCPKPEFIYEPLRDNRRQYAWVYIESLCAKEDDEDSRWRAEFLKHFQFKQVAYLPHAVRTDRFTRSEWLDLAVWALEAQHRDRIIDRPPGQY